MIQSYEVMMFTVFFRSTLLLFYEQCVCVCVFFFFFFFAEERNMMLPIFVSLIDNGFANFYLAEN